MYLYIYIVSSVQIKNKNVPVSSQMFLPPVIIHIILSCPVFFFFHSSLAGPPSCLRKILILQQAARVREQEMRSVPARRGAGKCPRAATCRAWHVLVQIEGMSAAAVAAEAATVVAKWVKADGLGYTRALAHTHMYILYNIIRDDRFIVRPSPRFQSIINAHFYISYQLCAP